MIKSIEQLINVGNDIRRALNLDEIHYQLYLEGEFIKFSIQNRLTKEILKLIPNDFFIYPGDNGVCKLRVFGMTKDCI